MPNALQLLNPPNQNQLYLVLNNAGYSQPDQSNALGLNSYQGRPLMVLREDQLRGQGVNALNQYPGFAPGQLEETAANVLNTGGNVATSMSPGVGDVRDLGEAIQGQDWWTGQQLTGPERLMSAGAAAIPFVGAGMGRAIGQATAPFAEDLKRAIQTPEFKNWFGKSVVVDESGEPLAVYHGTGIGGIKQFKPMQFFSQSPDDAAGYANASRANSLIESGLAKDVMSYKNFSSFAKAMDRARQKWHDQIYPVFLNIQNPLDITRFNTDEQIPLTYGAESTLNDFFGVTNDQFLSTLTNTLSVDPGYRFLVEHWPATSMTFRKIAGLTGANSSPTALQLILGQGGGGEHVNPIMGSFIKNLGYDGVLLSDRAPIEGLWDANIKYNKTYLPLSSEQVRSIWEPFK